MTLNNLLEELYLNNPGLRAALQAKWDRTIQVHCPFKSCQLDVDTSNGKYYSAVGPMACPCSLLPGAGSWYVDGLAKPQVPALIRGRHGSRVSRSRRRHVIPDWAR